MHIELRNVVKRFGRTVALDNASINLEGRVNLLAGPNGSGKTTLINVLAGLTFPEGGILSLDGEIHSAPRVSDWHRGVEKIRLRAGLLLDKPGLPGYLDGYELLESVAHSSGDSLDRNWIQGLVTNLGMSSYIDTRIGGYSSGMAQKLALAASLVTKPELVLWDEPTSNLDSWSRAKVVQLVQEMVSGGSIFVISTHVSADFEKVADWIAVMDLGRIVMSGKLSDYVSASPIIEARSKTPRKLASSLVGAGLAYSIVSVSADDVIFHASEEGMKIVSDIDTLTKATGCEVQSVTKVPRSIAEIQAEGLEKGSEQPG